MKVQPFFSNFNDSPTTLLEWWNTTNSMLRDSLAVLRDSKCIMCSILDIKTDPHKVMIITKCTPDALNSTQTNKCSRKARKSSSSQRELFFFFFSHLIKINAKYNATKPKNGGIYFVPAKSR